MIYERIEKALNSAIKLHNSGIGANDSIIKVAKELELNPETINRVVEAFNTAKTKAYVKVAQDKSADFDIADKKTVISSVFSDENNQSKTASIVTDMDDDLSEFSILIDKSSKVEEDDNNTISKTSDIPLESRIKKAFFAIQEQNRELSEKRDDIIKAKEDFYIGVKTASELLEFREEREKIASYASQIFYQYGDSQQAGRILGLIAKVAKISIDDLSDDLSGFVRYDTDNKFLNNFSSIVEAEDTYSSKIAEFNASVRNCAENEVTLRELVCQASGIDKEASASTFLWSPGRGNVVASQKFSEMPVDLIYDFDSTVFAESPKTKTSSHKAAADLITGTGIGAIKEQMNNNLKQHIVAPDLNEQVSKGYSLKIRGIESPKAQQQSKQELDNIKRESILRELLNDEIISQQDPSDVENSYNALIQLAPNASMIKDVARSVLRQGTAQVIDPHFANSLVELENNLLKAKNFDPKSQR